MRRRRINWDEEMQKSERIRMKGMQSTMVGCLMSFLFLVAVRKANPSWSPGTGILSFLLIAIAIVLTITLFFRHSRRKKNT